MSTRQRTASILRIAIRLDLRIFLLLGPAPPCPPKKADDCATKRASREIAVV
ncbi:uncharacterized protein METZ01_LOCUS167980, partial [marine metagenome]